MVLDKAIDHLYTEFAAQCGLLVIGANLRQFLLNLLLHLHCKLEVIGDKLQRTEEVFAHTLPVVAPVIGEVDGIKVLTCFWTKSPMA